MKGGFSKPPDLFVAQMMGQSGTSILHEDAKTIDEARREAIRNSRRTAILASFARVGSGIEFRHN